MGATQSQGKSRLPPSETNESTQRERKKVKDEQLKEEEKKMQHISDVSKRDEGIPKESLNDRIHSGLISNKGKKNWVDEHGCKCFMLSARELSITWSEDPRYWEWVRLEETSEVGNEVATLLKVCWLEIHGSFKKMHLTPGTIYEVAFVVMLKDSSFGWEVPVVLRLTSSGADVQEREEPLSEMPREIWIKVFAGTFAVSASDPDGEVHFSMLGYMGGLWKGGLVIKGVIIRSKK